MIAVDRMKEFAFPLSDQPNKSMTLMSWFVVRYVVAGLLLQVVASIVDAVSLLKGTGSNNKEATLVMHSTEISILCIIIIYFIVICSACVFRIRLGANLSFPTAGLSTPHLTLLCEPFADQAWG
jgi:hypothetical protein